jgi:hypothetical protein
MAINKILLGLSYNSEVKKIFDRLQIKVLANLFNGAKRIVGSDV